MGVSLFILFTAMEIILTVLNCSKFRKELAGTRNTAICFAVEFAVMILVILLPVNGQKFRFIGCLLIFGMRFAITGMVYIWRIIKHKAIGKPEKQTSKTGNVISCAADILLIFCFIFPSIVFPGFKEIEENSEKRAEIMQEILAESNDNTNPIYAKINTAIYNFVISE